MGSGKLNKSTNYKVQRVYIDGKVKNMGFPKNSKESALRSMENYNLGDKIDSVNGKHIEKHRVLEITSIFRIIE